MNGERKCSGYKHNGILFRYKKVKSCGGRRLRKIWVWETKKLANSLQCYCLTGRMSCGVISHSRVTTANNNVVYTSKKVQKI
jgi:hypothetical protein